jgi:leukotriene-A4 hydrolase
MPDPTTQSNYLQVVTQHVFFDWTIDWTQQIIFGSVLHRLIVKKDDILEVM